nr:hypothetical protein [Bacilli bacterium]
MSLISEKNHEKKLNDNNIRIKTIYSDGDHLYEKNTDNSKNDNLDHGIRVEKDYYVNTKLVKKIYGFDPRIEYAFINSHKIGTDFDCPNCRMITTVSEEIEYCPYCGSYFNLDYRHKNRGSKGAYDLAIHNNKYVVMSLIISLLASIGVSTWYFMTHGRTFNIYDIFKAGGIGLGVGLALFLIFYMLDNLFVLLPIKLKKNKINKSDSDVWTNLDSRNINYNTFYNNLYYEL